MTRRQLLAVSGVSALAWPLAALGQQTVHQRRIGVLLGTSESDPETEPRVAAFRRGLEVLGWAEGRNVRFDYRYAGGADRMREYAIELVKLNPDVILVQSNPGLAALRLVAGDVPIVFVQVADPVGSRFIASLARPGGNATGLTNFESSMGGKWLEVIKEIVPATARATVLLHPETTANVAFLRAAEAAAPSFAVILTGVGVHDAAEIEHAITAAAGDPGAALIVLPHVVTTAHRALIIDLAAKYRLPAVYPFRYFPTGGGLISYGIDVIDMYRQSSSYVDRILRGAKPAELPVQAPTKFELVINLKTAKALGLTIPPSILVRTDEVIE